MKSYKNIHIIGTSHIANESIKKVKEGFKLIEPDIVALELDNGRLYSLKNKVKRPKTLDLIKRIGLSGFLFYIFAEFIQKKLGKFVNIDPGSEMIEALRIAKKNNKQVELIDQNIELTLRRFSKYFKKKEILTILFDSIKGPFKKNELGKINLEKIPSDEVIEFVIKQAKQRYPSIYKILIDERDKFMAKKLFRLSVNESDKKIIAVVGAGHVKGMLFYLNELEKSNIVYKYD